MPWGPAIRPVPLGVVVKEAGVGQFNLLQLHEDNPRLAELVVRKLDERKARRVKRAIAAQRTQAHQHLTHRPFATDTMGEQQMAMHPVLVTDAAYYFRDKDGNPDHAWMDDPDKRRHIMKLNPATRVRSRGTRIGTWDIEHNPEKRTVAPEQRRWEKRNGKQTMNFGVW